jgi:hypothetical protein
MFWYVLITKKKFIFLQNSIKIDIDECKDETQVNNCNRYATCVNTYGSYMCSCEPGFTGNGSQCEDIDECSLVDKPNEFLCNNTGKCINTIGFYKCECQKGYTNTDNSSVCLG